MSLAGLSSLSTTVAKRPRVWRWIPACRSVVSGTGAGILSGCVPTDRTRVSQRGPRLCSTSSTHKRKGVEALLSPW